MTGEEKKYWDGKHKEIQEKHDELLEKAYVLYQERDQGVEDLTKDEFAEEHFEDHDYMESLLPEELWDDYDDVWEWLIFGDIPD